MKAQNITIDINKLDAAQLEQLFLMLHITKQPAVKAVSNRFFYLVKWMTEEEQIEYAKKYL